MRSTLLAAVLVLSGIPVAAQWTPTHGFFDHDRNVWAPDKAMHTAAGGVLDVVVRGPWIAKSFRDRPWKRVLMVATIGAAYELTDWQRAASGGRVGFGALDLAADVLGAVLVELVLR